MLSNTSMNKTKKPLIGISCCRNKVGIHDFHMVADKYISAAVEASNAIPVLIPASGEKMIALLPYLDGLYLTGSYSNLEPHHYQEQPITDNTESPIESRDKKRDETNLALIQGALAVGMPVLGICRGFQEMNVALGGSLHQRLASDASSLNHAEDKKQTLTQQYATAHNIELVKSGLLATMMNGELQQEVNSLHQQGINRLAEPLKIEALAPDGLIEGFSLKENGHFFLGVQWHAEWKLEHNPFYHSIFTAFGQACQRYQLTK